MDTKVCSKCGIEKSLISFRNNKNSPEYKRKKRESDKKYRLENIEKITKQASEYYEKNKEDLNEKGRDYYKENKEKFNKAN